MEKIGENRLGYHKLWNCKLHKICGITNWFFVQSKMRYLISQFMISLSNCFFFIKLHKVFFFFVFHYLKHCVHLVTQVYFRIAFVDLIYDSCYKNPLCVTQYANYYCKAIKDVIDMIWLLRRFGIDLHLTIDDEVNQ